MAPVKKRVTSRKLAANRANSKKSAGPRTALGKSRAARNSGKYFIFGQVTPSRMEQIGEDPDEFERLRQSLRSAIGPRDGFEELLVEEMAVNRWRLGRLRRAEMGTLRCERLKLIAKKYEIETGVPNVDNASLGIFGLVGAANSPQRFSKVLELLEVLRTKVEEEGFTPQGLELLETIYGLIPDVPGAALIAQFKAGMSDDDPDDEDIEDDRPDDDQDEGAAQPGDEDGDEEQDDDATGSETARAPEGGAGSDAPSESYPAPSGAELRDGNPPAAEAEPEGDRGQEGEEAAGELPRPLSKAESRAEARLAFLASLEREAKSFGKLVISDAFVRKTPVPQAAEDACMIPFKDNLEQIMSYEKMLQSEFERLQKQLRAWRESNRESLPPGRPRKVRRQGIGSPVACES